MFNRVSLGANRDIKANEEALESTVKKVIHQGISSFVLTKCQAREVVHSKKILVHPKKKSEKNSKDFLEDLKSVHLIWE